MNMGNWKNKSIYSISLVQKKFLRGILNATKIKVNIFSISSFYHTLPLHPVGANMNIHNNLKKCLPRNYLINHKNRTNQ